MKNALEAFQLAKKSDENIDKWLNIMDEKIDQRIACKRFNLIITSLSPLGYLLKNKTAREKVLRKVKELGYQVTYYAGFYGHPSYIVIDWSESCLSDEQQKQVQLDQLAQELKEIKNGLTVEES